MQLICTPKAIRFMERILRFARVQNAAFRLRVRMGGCTGLASEFDVEVPAQESAELIEVSGVRLLVDEQSRQLLAGATVDYSDSIVSPGFIVTGPGVPVGSCGTVGTPGLVSIGSQYVR